MNRDQFDTVAQNWFEGQNKAIVFIQNGELFTDSLVVAEKFGKDHDKVVRDIRVQLTKLEEADEKEWGTANFGETHYQHPQNQQWYPKYNMTEDAFAIIAMSYTTPEAMKMKVKFLAEFKRMRQQLQAGIDMKRLSPELQYMIKLEQRTDGIEQEVSALKNVVDNEVWITEAQRGQIRTAVNNRARHLLINGYGNAHFQGIYSTLKTHFGVSKYDKIPRKDFDIALEIIRGWFPKTRQSRA